MAPKKRIYSVSFKREVIRFINEGHTAYNAAQFFAQRDRCLYDPSMFRQWKRQEQKLMEDNTLGATKKRVKGGGRKPKLVDVEDILVDEIIDMRVRKLKVTRGYIASRASQLADDSDIDVFKASGHWVSLFMKRHGFSLRRRTNLTTLTDAQLIQRAVDYVTYLHSRVQYLNASKTLLMDETAVYFEDTRTHTVDIKGRSHVVVKSTGFSSMRITACVSVWADGRKGIPLLIHKGSIGGCVTSHGGILSTTQKKCWVNSDVIVKWIDVMFPVVDASAGKCIVWDSCRVHISRAVKDHCHRRGIELIVIPGGLTPYLQAGDIGIYRQLKDLLSEIINAWKNSDDIEFTRGGNPKPPAHDVVRQWFLDSWNAVSMENITNSIRSAGFSPDYEEWHISKHDVYGDMFKAAWVNRQVGEVMLEDLEAIPQDDDMFEGIDVDGTGITAADDDEMDVDSS